jgi:uncharacterized protein (UPF0332 family)
MTRQERIDLSKIRLEKAEEFLLDAVDSATRGRFLTCANRSYYAVYSSIRALLILEHTEMVKHQGNISKFCRLYIKTGIFKDEFSEFLKSLFRIRLDSDYDPAYIIVKAEVLIQLDHAKEMVGAISSYLEEKYKE